MKEHSADKQRTAGDKSIHRTEKILREVNFSLFCETFIVGLSFAHINI